MRANNQTPSYGRDAKAMFSYAAWVREQMAINRPLNEFVADLLLVTLGNEKVWNTKNPFEFMEMIS